MDFPSSKQLAFRGSPPFSLSLSLYRRISYLFASANTQNIQDFPLLAEANAHVQCVRDFPLFATATIVTTQRITFFLSTSAVRQ